MHDGAPTNRHRLPSELVALIHHVELSEAGWRDRLLDQLVMALMFLRATPCGAEELRTSLYSNFSLTTDDKAFDQSVKRLLESRSLLEIDGGRLKLAENAAKAAQATIAANQSLEEQVAKRFKAIVAEEAKELNPDDCWRRFCDDCLDPLVAELGARTYELIAVPAGGSPGGHSITGYVDSYPQGVRIAIQKSIDRFLDPTDTDVRSFVLSRLHSHLLTLAASLSEQTLDDLAAKTKSNLQLKLFLDTNFLFSVLDLHDNPANAVVRNLIQLLGDVENHVRSKLYVFPLTVDEIKRTLSGVRLQLSGVEVTPRLGWIARKTPVGQGSGIRARFLRAVASATHRLTAQDYLDPYINDLIAVLRDEGLDLYNENVESLTTSQEVLDDIQAQEKNESRRPVEKRKKYEALRHDVALWHFVSGKRSARVDSPLDAVFWAVTIDRGLLRFDRHKTQGRGMSAVPICVHPAVLIQMLQLWLPRTPRFDEAMLQSVRALLPLPTAPDVEEVILKILRTLSRFEEIDSLSDETVSSVLLNRALRGRMETETETGEQEKLIREALVGELAATEEKLRKETDIRSAVEDELHGVQNRADELEQETRKGQSATKELHLDLQQEQKLRQELEQETRKGQSATKELHLDLQQEQKSRQELEAKLALLEATASRQEDFQRRLLRASFVIIAPLLLALAMAVVAPGARWLDNLTGYQGHRSTAIVGLLMLTLWTFVVDCSGRQIQNISTWRPFNVFHRVKNWLFSLFGSILVGLLTILIWEHW